MRGPASDKNFCHRRACQAGRDGPLRADRCHSASRHGRHAGLAWPRPATHHRAVSVQECHNHIALLVDRLLFANISCPLFFTSFHFIFSRPSTRFIFLAGWLVCRHTTRVSMNWRGETGETRRASNPHLLASARVHSETSRRPISLATKAASGQSAHPSAAAPLCPLGLLSGVDEFLSIHRRAVRGLSARSAPYPVCPAGSLPHRRQPLCPHFLYKEAWR